MLSATTIDEIASLSETAGAAEFAVQPSVEQVAVTGAAPDVDLVLFDQSGAAAALGTTDEQGSLVFRQVTPGAGYRVANAQNQDDPDVEQVASDPFEVVAIEDSTPQQSFYDAQTLEPGFTYVETRDGTTLSASVYLPGPVEDGPYPTVVEYSGYSPSKPAVNLIGERWDDIKDGLPDGLTEEAVCELAGFACAAPDQPASLLAHAMGYAVVAVNIRGTGCSGGSYDFFEPLQLLDGYDVIETVAAQDWVKNNRVGMVGLSYPGISQLFVASTQPPSLAAIMPFSVYDDTARGVLAPGGIFNEGFALQWAENVLDDAEPYGQGWEQDVVDAGDTECATNQLLRGQNVDAVARARSYPNYVPEVADPLSFEKIGPNIEAAVFYTSSFQDEQVGGRAPLMFDDLTSAPVVRLNAWNGAHVDGFAPQNLVEWKTFMDLYVNGEQTPRSLPFELFAPLVFGEAFGVSPALPPQRVIPGEDIEAQRAAYEAEPPVRILLENGAGDPDEPGSPIATAEVLADTWPLPGTTPVSYWFGPDGTLTTEAPGDDERRVRRGRFRRGRERREPFRCRSVVGPAQLVRGRRRQRPVPGGRRVRLASGARRLGDGVRLGAAGGGSAAHRLGQCRSVDPLQLPGGRPRGDAVRGPPRRVGDLHPVRGAARHPSSHHCGIDPAAAADERAGRGCRTAADRRVRRDACRDLPVRARRA